MSDAKHSNEATFQVHIDKKLLKEFNEAIPKLGYKNRADWLREQMRITIQKAQK